MNNRSANISARPSLTINVSRGDMIESRHLVNAVISDASGKVVQAYGDTDKPVYLRSAIKPLQALPLVESGAADAFQLSDQELSLACASHTGEELHVEAVTRWLDRMGLSIADLECGNHWPTYPPAERALAAQGKKPTAAHNNCSGKHAGFLATSLHLKEDYKEYIRLDHPVQQRIKTVLEEFTDLDLSRAPIGIDGCSIPTIGIPLQNAAMAVARFADPEQLGDARRNACQRIQAAIAKAPEMIAGSDRLCTALNGSADGKVIAKTGAEGVYLAALPDLGFGIALKAVDGTTRAAEVALGALLEEVGVLTDKMHAEIDPFILPTLKNWNDFEFGKIQAESE
ncbi:MAG: asparaginase [Sneathiella sp.]